MRKTNKEQLLRLLEKNVNPLESYPPNSTTIYDGMALVKILAEKIFELVFSTNSRRIDVVFNCYWDISIKNAERTQNKYISGRSKISEYFAYLSIKSMESRLTFMDKLFNPTQTGLFALYITGGSRWALIFNHLTLNFPQYFFDLSLIRIRKKK